MDDYGCQHFHAQPYPFTHNALALVPSAYSPSFSSSASVGLFSDGFFPAYDQLQDDPFLFQSDQQSFHNLMVNEGFDQFDPVYASLELPHYGTPLQDLQGSDSTGTDSIESPLLWSNALVPKGLDTGVMLLCDQAFQPLQVISDVDSKECEIIPSEQDGVKNEAEQSGRPKRARKRPARQMRECDTNGHSNNKVADSLTWEILSQYFYMPIAQAARELNIGLTLFKKRCRELGVRRWPHRKLMSIQSLIKNVKEMEKGAGLDPTLSKVTIRNAIQELEYQRKLMEVMPDIELEVQTKRLRQACFKANYKKRRLMTMNGSCFDNSTASFSSNQFSIVDSNVDNNGCVSAQELQDSDELKSLLFDSLSPSDCSFLNEFK